MSQQQTTAGSARVSERMSRPGGLRRLTSLLILAALAAVAANRAAAEDVEHKMSLDGNGMVVIKVVKGEVRVEGWDREELLVRGEVGEGSDRLLMEGNSQRREIEVKIPRNSRGVEGSELEFFVPAGASVVVETTSADIIADGLGGELVELRAVSGDIEADAGGERLFAHTVSGDVELESEARRVDINSVSGDIDARLTGEEVDANTVSGELLLIARSLDRGHFESVSGDMELDVALAGTGVISVASLSGDVDLILPGDLSATCEAESFSGSIKSTRGQVEKAKYGPHKTLRFVSGDGSGRVQVESFSGDVRIRER
ncbi:MAG: DUF4097 family beta strand repeat-containing protein [Pseudomonadota bacterium]